MASAYEKESKEQSVQIYKYSTFHRLQPKTLMHSLDY